MAATIVCLTLVATAWARHHHGPVLPAAIEAFYDAIEDAGRHDKCKEALKHFTTDAVWAHTGATTANGLEDIQHVFQDVAGSKITDTTLVDLVTNKAARSVIVTRMFRSMSQMAKRESFFLEGDRIKSVWTTKASPWDPADNGMPWVGEGTTPPSSNVSGADEENVKSAVDLYFTSFVNHKPEQMQAAFWLDAIHLFDFNGARMTPFGCHTDPAGCSTSPYFNSRHALLPTFIQLTMDPGLINIATSYNVVALFGDIALVTTRSYGCEGIYVTPDGAFAMANRGMFVAVRRSGQWKIKSYMYTDDPAEVPNLAEKKCFNKESISV